MEKDGNIQFQSEDSSSLDDFDGDRFSDGGHSMDEGGQSSTV
jgi:hypothetical protein